MGHFNTFVMVHDDWMRTWEHDENWTYAHIFGILRWYPLRLLFTIKVGIYDLYDMIWHHADELFSGATPITIEKPPNEINQAPWLPPERSGRPMTLEPADPVVSCGELKNRAGWRWCWVRNKTTLNFKGLTVSCFIMPCIFFDTSRRFG